MQVEQQRRRQRQQVADQVGELLCPARGRGRRRGSAARGRRSGTGAPRRPPPGASTARRRGSPGGTPPGGSLRRARAAMKSQCLEVRLVEVSPVARTAAQAAPDPLDQGRLEAGSSAASSQRGTCGRDARGTAPPRSRRRAGRPRPPGRMSSSDSPRRAGAPRCARGQPRRSSSAPGTEGSPRASPQRFSVAARHSRLPAPPGRGSVRSAAAPRGGRNGAESQFRRATTCTSFSEVSGSSRCRKARAGWMARQ